MRTDIIVFLVKGLERFFKCVSKLGIGDVAVQPFVHLAGKALFHSFTQAAISYCSIFFVPRWRRERLLIIFGSSRNDINTPTPVRT